MEGGWRWVEVGEQFSISLLRISPENFDEPLALIEMDIQKEDTMFRKAIPEKAKDVLSTRSFILLHMASLSLYRGGVTSYKRFFFSPRIDKILGEFCSLTFHSHVCETNSSSEKKNSPQSQFHVR